MQVQDFLDAVLPTAGIRCAGALAAGRFTNVFGPDNAWLERSAARLDSRAVDAYYALSTFASANGGRKQANVAAVRAFWLDIDTRESKPREAYADRKEAVRELTRFCADLGLPAPWLVSSGYGVHAYWPMWSDMLPGVWLETSSLLKAACKQWGLAADPSRTSDSASVLRMPGTHNYKGGGRRAVTLLRGGPVATREDFHKALVAYVTDVPVLKGSSAGVPNINADLISTPDYPPSSAHVVAEHCGVIRLLRDTAGNVDQPTWFHGLGVIAFTEEGEDVCHAWSAGHPEYNQAETTAKVAQVKRFNPTTCRKLSDFQPAICAACPHNGKITSPITLGTSKGEPQVLPTPTPIYPVNAPAPPPLTFPDGYGFGVVPGHADKMLWRSVREEDPDTGQVTWARQGFSNILFYPTVRIESTDSKFEMNIHAIYPNGDEKDFVIPHSLVAEGGKPLSAALASQEIAVGPAARPEVDRYLLEWISALQDGYTKTPAIRQFGWHGDDFVIGKDYVAKGGMRAAVVHSDATPKARHLVTGGDLQTWVTNVDRAYNRPGEEGLQFCVLVAFAAPLWRLWGQNGGVTVFAHSSGSGYGKTTAQMVGLSAWGKASELLLRESSYTENALWQHLGIMHNLPGVIDEMTNCKPEFASQLVYAASAGQGKLRMRAEGGERESLHWSTIVAASGNNLLSDKLSLHRANAEAELARLWEFTLTKKSTIPPNVADPLFASFSDNYGHAGRVYAQYLVDNKDKVQAMLFEMRRVFNQRAKIMQAERYWSMLHACTLTSLVICRKLGLVSFDVNAMFDWILLELEKNRGQMISSVSKPVEQFADMLTDIWAGVLVTEGEGNLTHGAAATVACHPKGGVITGRSILPDRYSSEKLFISVAAVREWCSRKGVSMKVIHDELVRHSFAAPEVKRMSLGRGTNQYSSLAGPVKVWEINPSAVRDAVGISPTAPKIVSVLTSKVV